MFPFHPLCSRTRGNRYDPVRGAEAARAVNVMPEAPHAFPKTRVMKWPQSDRPSEPIDGVIAGTVIDAIVMPATALRRYCGSTPASCSAFFQTVF